MPRFRASPAVAPSQPLTLDGVRQVASEVWQSQHFFAQGLELRWASEPEEIAWEIFRGRLLDAAHTRERRQFHAWHVVQRRDGEWSPEPVLSLKLDAGAGELHVVRALPCHAWEAYDAGGNVILSRETIKWVRELVGTIALADFASTGELRDELICLIFSALVGTSRLPLTSIEAPLPAFTFGQLAYVFRAEVPAPADSVRPGMQTWRELVDQGLNAELCRREQVKLLEVLLRAVPPQEVAAAAAHFARRWQSLGRPLPDIPMLWREMFNEVSLSPYTDFTDKSLALLDVLVEQGRLTITEQVDCLGWLLRRLGRHLTAYDLVTFHHRGANYPDALLLDAALAAYLTLAERHTYLFAGAQAADDQKRQRLLRRALRQACLFRLLYAGHPVPDAPTSPGENLRVLPAPHLRVPEEQVLQPGKRTRRLYADVPLERLLNDATRQLLQRALDDMQQADELSELGTAVFIDRPLGIGKPPGAVDQTPLLGHEAFSRKVSGSRLRDLGRLASALGLRFDCARSEELLARMPLVGLGIAELWTPERSAVSLADARRVADDFVLRRTLASSVKMLFQLFPLGDVGRRLSLDLSAARLWLMPVAEGRLAVFDSGYRKRLEVEIGPKTRVRAGVELPADGLRLLRIWRDLPAGQLQEQAVGTGIG